VPVGTSEWAWLRRTSVGVLLVGLTSPMLLGCSREPLQFHSAAPLAQAIDCHDFHAVPKPDPASGVPTFREAGTCVIGDESEDVVKIFVFEDDSARDALTAVHDGETTGEIGGTCYWVQMYAGMVHRAASKIDAPMMGEG